MISVGREDALADAGERLATPVRDSCNQLVDAFRWIHWIFMPRHCNAMLPRHQPRIAVVDQDHVCAVAEGTIANPSGLPSGSCGIVHRCRTVPPCGRSCRSPCRGRPNGRGRTTSLIAVRARQDGSVGRGGHVARRGRPARRSSSGSSLPEDRRARSARSSRAAPGRESRDKARRLSRRAPRYRRRSPCLASLRRRSAPGGRAAPRWS